MIYSVISQNRPSWFHVWLGVSVGSILQTEKQIWLSSLNFTLSSVTGKVPLQQIRQDSDPPRLQWLNCFCLQLLLNLRGFVRCDFFTQWNKHSAGCYVIKLWRVIYCAASAGCQHTFCGPEGSLPDKFRSWIRKQIHVLLGAAQTIIHRLWLWSFPNKANMLHDDFQC